MLFCASLLACFSRHGAVWVRVKGNVNVCILVFIVWKLFLDTAFLASESFLMPAGESRYFCFRKSYLISCLNFLCFCFKLLSAHKLQNRWIDVICVKNSWFIPQRPWKSWIKLLHFSFLFSFLNLKLIHSLIYGVSLLDIL